MINMLRDWKGAVEINGTKYNSINDFLAENINISGNVAIKLYSQERKAETAEKQKILEVKNSGEIKITVKAYMTKPTEAGSSFDFMEKWNNNKPMPLRTMQGTIVQETRGMLKMKLHGMGYKDICCMRCGRQLTNPVSRHYGIGPECMGKLGIVADIDDISSIKEQLEKVEWEGWVIKSAILEREEV